MVEIEKDHNYNVKRSLLNQLNQQEERVCVQWGGGGGGKEIQPTLLQLKDSPPLNDKNDYL